MAEMGSMTRPSTRLRTAHRVHSGVTIAVAVTLLALNLAGALSGGMALGLFLAIEVPLILVFAVISVLRFGRFGRTTGADGTDFLDRLEAEEPLLRPVVSELRAFTSLFLVIGRKRQLPPGAEPFGYTKGTMTLPAVLTVLSLVELLIVHILVPWPWLQIVLLVLTVWGVFFILGFFASRVVRPHFVTADRLHLRWGHKTVLTSPLANILSVARRTNHAHTQPQIEGNRLVLTQFQSTNVLIRFVEPVPAAAPVARRHRPEGFHASEVHLYVDDPDAFLHALPSPPRTLSP